MIAIRIILRWCIRIFRLLSLRNNEQIDTTESTVKPEISMNILQKGTKVDKDLDTMIKPSMYI